MNLNLLELLALLGLFLLDGILGIGGAAFGRANPARLMTMREENERAVERTLRLLDNLPKLLASFELVQMLARFGIALLVGFWSLQLNFYYSPYTNILAILLAIIVTFWLEWLIKRPALQSPEVWALRLTGLGFVVRAIAFIFVWPVRKQEGELISNEPSSGLTEDELMTLVDAGEEEGVVEQGERQMIYSVFQLGETLVREIMVPRIDMLALEVSTPLVDAVDAIVKSGHSRVPVFQETVDQTLGVVYAKDLLRLWHQDQQDSSLHDLLRPAYFVPEAMRVDELLAEMQVRGVHMAIAVDEYGGVAGLVTLEDIVEEIVGEIRDEYDQAEEAPYLALKDGDILFLGKVTLDDFNEVMNSELSSDETDTIGGFIYNSLGKVPQVGESVEAGGLHLTVEQVNKRRIVKVRAHRTEPGQNYEKERQNDRG